MIPLLSLLPDAALPGPSLLPARLYSSWYLPRVPDPDLGPGLALREYCRNFRRQNKYGDVCSCVHSIYTFTGL